MNTNQTIATKIPISYETDDIKVSFSIEFGKSLDADKCKDANMRTKFNTPYDIEIHTIENKKMYCLLAEEGPFALQITDVNVESKTNLDKRKINNGYITYKYGITTVVDMNKEPVYSPNTSVYIPCNNIERDGLPWIVYNNKTLRVDQNGEAMFQWSTARALEKGVKPTPEQELMGIEERHENTGMIYITFQPFYTEETHIEEVTRGLTRGLTRSITMEGMTRGITSSHAARVGYGSRAETKSKTGSVTPITNSRYILPIRVRNIGEISTNTKCAKDLKSAIRVEELQKNTGVLPDY